MILLIDGYNYIKNIFSGVKNNMDEQRRIFIRQLSSYKTFKNDTIKDIILVFDAGPLGHATREISGGVVIVFSGQRSCADDWIVEYIERNKNQEIVLVSNDRGLMQRCKAPGVDVISVNEFHAFLHNAMEDEQNISNSFILKHHSSLKKYENQEDVVDNDIDRRALDSLMEEATLNIDFKEKNAADLQMKETGPRKTLSKKEKRISRKLKKL